MHIVFNNVPFHKTLTTSWGFSCFVSYKDQGILFDTGGDGEILLSNMEKMGVQPNKVDLIVLSHIHWDHTGGLERFLEKKAGLRVCVPESFPRTFNSAIGEAGAEVFSTPGPMTLSDGLHISGEMGAGIKEQCLILKTGEGLVIITGCAHPGIVHMVRHAKTWLKDDIYLVLGGFHLKGQGEVEVSRIIDDLQALGVKKVAPSHCTGQKAMALFRKAWQKDFLHGGCGAVIALP